MNGVEVKTLDWNTQKWTVDLPQRQLSEVSGGLMFEPLDSIANFIWGGQFSVFFVANILMLQSDTWCMI